MGKTHLLREREKERASLL